MLKHQKILIRSGINFGIEVIVTKKLVLVVKSSDESRAVVCHVFSVAGVESVWEGEWTEAQLA